MLNCAIHILSSNHLNAVCVSYQQEFIVTHACRKTRRGEHKSNENKGQGRNRKGRRVFTTHDMFPQCTNQRQRSLASGQKNDELHGPNVGCGQVEYIHQPSSEFSSKKSQIYNGGLGGGRGGGEVEGDRPEALCSDVIIITLIHLVQTRRVVLRLRE